MYHLTSKERGHSETNGGQQQSVHLPRLKDWDCCGGCFFSKYSSLMLLFLFHPTELHSLCGVQNALSSHSYSALESGTLNIKND